MRSRSWDVGIFRRALDKLIVGPIKYRSPRGYDAQRYWDDRLSSYGMSLQGVGHEGLSEADNEQMYAEAGRTFDSLVQPIIGNQPPATLEIGCGVGFYTGRLRALGVTDYTGLDITDALFSSLRDRFPNYSFVRGDITSYTASEKYGLLVMIDVTEHIVTLDGLRSAIGHLKDATMPGGTVVIGPQFDKGTRHLYYVHFWSVDEIASQFEGWRPLFRDAYRGGWLLGFQKPRP